MLEGSKGWYTRLWVHIPECFSLLTWRAAILSWSLLLGIIVKERTMSCRDRDAAQCGVFLMFWTSGMKGWNIHRPDVSRSQFFMTSSFSKKSSQFFLNVKMLYTHFSMVGSLKNICTCNRLYEFLHQDIKFWEIYKPTSVWKVNWQNWI